MMVRGLRRMSETGRKMNKGNCNYLGMSTRVPAIQAQVLSVF